MTFYAVEKVAPLNCWLAPHVLPVAGGCGSRKTCYVRKGTMAFDLLETSIRDW